MLSLGMQVGADVIVDLSSRSIGARSVAGWSGSRGGGDRLHGQCVRVVDVFVISG